MTIFIHYTNYCNIIFQCALIIIRMNNEILNKSKLSRFRSAVCYKQIISHGVCLIKKVQLNVWIKKTFAKQHFYNFSISLPIFAETDNNELPSRYAFHQVMNHRMHVNGRNFAAIPFMVQFMNEERKARNYQL